ncbi:MAG TPA: hypothetical protein PKX79_03430 [Spirochaetota bacterium]|nr:hypothetical protein [Spirochaetota bacterium]HOK91837.1 hypothetical protein [Spirochaetota bacterium]HON15267.1 hypothetical protein [Spirochaetota bacterium]HPP94418.1 hypothetical protein [Spirochaetota bacterium]HRS62848.1 hypothetical protein [Spirochaetota bacterium]
MKKSASEITVREMTEIVKKYIRGSHNLNFAIKILGHPGVGKSAVVKKIAEEENFYFIDTRLAFKENVDLGGYPVPDHNNKQMIYFRPKFIPPEKVPEGYDGILWFLDESNRAHPTVIQTLFQIITEKRCGEHILPEKTSIILAGNLGEEDDTTITEFDDSALDGRLAIFHLKPSAEDWLSWAADNNIHPSVIQYISTFPERLWDEKNVNPNPRGWHQVSSALLHGYNLKSHEDLKNFLQNKKDSTLEKLIYSLVGNVAGTDFFMQLLSPRLLSSEDIVMGNEDKLTLLKERKIPAEDILWALNGTIEILNERALLKSGNFDSDDLRVIGNILKFIGYSRGDIRMAYFFLLVKECGIFSIIPEAIKRIEDVSIQNELKSRYGDLLV